MAALVTERRKADVVSAPESSVLVKSIFIASAKSVVVAAVMLSAPPVSVSVLLVMVIVSLPAKVRSRSLVKARSPFIVKVPVPKLTA